MSRHESYGRLVCIHIEAVPDNPDTRGAPDMFERIGHRHAAQALHTDPAQAQVRVQQRRKVAAQMRYKDMSQQAGAQPDKTGHKRSAGNRRTRPNNAASQIAASVHIHQRNNRLCRPWSNRPKLILKEEPVVVLLLRA